MHVVKLVAALCLLVTFALLAVLKGLSYNADTRTFDRIARTAVPVLLVLALLVAFVVPRDWVFELVFAATYVGVVLIYLGIRRDPNRESP